MPNQIDKLDEILQKVLLVWKQDYPQPDGDNGLLMDEYFERLENAKTEAKTEILKHYISREEVLGKLPSKCTEDVKVITDMTKTYSSREAKDVQITANLCRNQGYNQALDHVRQALTTNVKEHNE